MAWSRLGSGPSLVGTDFGEEFCSLLSVAVHNPNECYV